MKVECLLPPLNLLLPLTTVHKLESFTFSLVELCPICAAVLKQIYSLVLSQARIL